MVHKLKEYSLSSIGTVRKNKTSAHEIFKKRTKLNRSRFGFQNITFVSYVPKKNKDALLMSPLHHYKNVD